MPELPEVETTRRGIRPAVEGRRVERVLVRERRLRWPVSSALERELRGAAIDRIDRRAKYLVFRTSRGSMLLHLGMSGRLSLVEHGVAPERHDHVDWLLDSGKVLRFHDPRRFGSVHWTRKDPLLHPLLAELGPEPLDRGWSGESLYKASRGRKVAVKSLLMDARVVVGVGNIYANEALFLAGIAPGRAAGRISRDAYDRLARAVKSVLRSALRKGGTSIRDFLVDGLPGSFALDLRVYDRPGERCTRCAAPIKERRLGQRSTFYCPRCQR